MNSKKVNILLEKIFAETGLGKWLAKKAAKNSSSSIKKRNADKKTIKSKKENTESKGKKPVFVKTGVSEIKESYNVFSVEGASNVFTMNFDTIEAHELLPCDVIINESGQMLEVDYIEESNGLYHVTFLNNNCESIEIFESNTVMGFVDNIEDTSYNEYNEKIEIYEDGNKKVKLNKIMSGDVKKYKVFVKNDRGNVVKVNFGDPNMEIKRDNPARRRNFRARHRCDTPGPRWKARYWACRTWSTQSVSSMLKENTDTSSKLQAIKLDNVTKSISENTLNSLLTKPYNPNLYGLMNKKIIQN
jgi:hypothetical protein